MNDESTAPASLTEQQKKVVCAVVANGCDRETAAKYARTTWVAIHAVMSKDRDFAAQVRFDEATVELKHMRNVHKAAEDKSNWRASVWWLEALHPERYGPRGSGLVTTRQLKLYTEHVATTLVSEVRDEEDRARLWTRLHETSELLDRFLRDDFAAPRLLDDEEPIGGIANSTPGESME